MQLHSAMEDDYQNEDYHSEEYQNDTISKKLSHTLEAPSGHGSSESVTTRSEDAGTDYEYIPDPAMMMRKLPEKELKTEQALFPSSAGKWKGSCSTPVIVVYVLALLSLIVANAALVIAFLRCFSSCPSEWPAFQEKCYYYSQSKETWENSRRICRDLNADLAVINDIKEQDFLVNNKQLKQSHWIGYSDMEKEGTWKWVDGTNTSYTYWATGKPNNEAVLSLGGEDCAVLEEEDSYKWWNVRCSQPYLFICEMNVELACVWKVLRSSSH